MIPSHNALISVLKISYKPKKTRKTCTNAFPKCHVRILAVRPVPCQASVVPDSPRVTQQGEPDFSGWTPEQVLQYQRNKLLQTSLETGKANADAAKIQAEANKVGAEANKHGSEAIHQSTINHAKHMQLVVGGCQNDTPPVHPGRVASPRRGIFGTAYDAIGDIFKSSPAKENALASTMPPPPTTTATTAPAGKRPFPQGDWAALGTDREQLVATTDALVHYLQANSDPSVKVVCMRYLSFLFVNCGYKKGLDAFLKAYSRQPELLACLRDFGWLPTGGSATATTAIGELVWKYSLKFNKHVPVMYFGKEFEGQPHRCTPAIVVSRHQNEPGSYTIRLEDGREKQTLLEFLSPTGSIDVFLQE